jgi:hypothetical protein
MSWPEVRVHFEYKVMSKFLSKPAVFLLPGNLVNPPRFPMWRIALETGAENWIVTVDTFGQLMFGFAGVG